VIVAIGALGGGLAGRKLEPGERIRPNQGIRNSLYTASVTALIAGLLVGSCAGITAALLAQNEQSVFYPALWPIYFGCFSGIIGALYFGFRNGGIVCLQHSLLRLLLWLNRETPFRYIAFLDEAAHSRLLRKIGSGYIFLHRLLLEYFNRLESPSSLSADETDDALASPDGQVSLSSSTQPLQSGPLQFAAPPLKRPHHRKFILPLTVSLLFLLTSVLVLPPAIDQYQADRDRQAMFAQIASLPNPYLTNISSTLAYYDPLSRPYLWRNTNYRDGSEECVFTGNVYHLKAAPGITAYCDPYENDSPLLLDNFVLEWQLQFPAQGCGGIKFRVDQQLLRGYWATICQNRLIAFRQETSTGIPILTSLYSKDLQLEPGSFNTIALVVNHNLFQLYINGKENLEISHNDYNGDLFELAAGSTNGRLDIVFRKVKIWKLLS
jgi:hypothetical protein